MHDPRGRVAGQRIALLGCGRWGRLVLRDLLGLGARVVVVAPSERTRESARAAGAEAVLTDVAGLRDVEGVVVVTPTHLHAASVASVLPLGVPVFVEKPLTASPEEARRLAAAAGERIFVMDKWRYHAGVERLADLLKEGALGAPRSLHTLRLQWGSPHRDVDPVWVLAPHDLAIALEVLGFLPEPAAARAERSGDEVRGLGALLGTADGPGPWMSLAVSASYPTHRRELRLAAEEGVALLADAYAEHLLVFRHGSEEPERIALPARMPLEDELRAFLAFLGGGPAPRSSAAEGVAVVESVARLRALAGLDQPE